MFPLPICLIRLLEFANSSSIMSKALWVYVSPREYSIYRSAFSNSLLPLNWVNPHSSWAFVLKETTPTRLCRDPSPISRLSMTRTTNASSFWKLTSVRRLEDLSKRKKISAGSCSQTETRFCITWCICKQIKKTHTHQNFINFMLNVPLWRM